MRCFPFMADISKKPCLLVGGGKVAARKAEILASFGAELIVCARELSPEFPRSLAVRIYGEYSPDLLEGMAFAVAATSDRALNAKVSGDCRARKIPVNSVDDRENCDFFFPALIRRGEVTIGISTGGVSPALAAALKDWIADSLPENLEEIAAQAKRMRATMSAADYTVAVRHLLPGRDEHAD